MYLSDSIDLLCTSASAPSARSFSLCLVGPLPRRRSSILAARTRVRDQGTPAAYKCALIAVHVVAKPSFSTTKVETKPPLLPMTPVPRSRLTTRPPTRATLCRFKTTLTSRFAKTRSLCVLWCRRRRLSSSQNPRRSLRPSRPSSLPRSPLWVPDEGNSPQTPSARLCAIDAIPTDRRRPAATKKTRR